MKNRKYIKVFEEYSNNYLSNLQQKAISIVFEYINTFDILKNYPNLFNSIPIKLVKILKNKINWFTIAITQSLTEDFIIEFQDKVNWRYISIYQTLSEEFIREFQDKVIWLSIFKYQNLSKKFRQEFKHKLNEK